MKVVLLQDVAKIGRRHQVVDVPAGYAQNLLIPKRMAVPATPDNLKKIAVNTEAAVSAKASVQAAFTAAAATLMKSPVIVTADANDQSHLFKAIHEADIVLAAAEQGITFVGSRVIIVEPIKALGDHTVTLTAGTEQCQFVVRVIKK